MPGPAPVGLITGTGLYQLEGLAERRVEVVETPHGPAQVTSGRLAGVPVVHVPRHGSGHSRLSIRSRRAPTWRPSRPGGRSPWYRPRCAGRWTPSLELGSLVVFDDLHFPSNRLPDGSLCTLFTSPDVPGRGHWIFERPFGERVRAGLLSGAEAAGLEARDGGTYGHVDGPRLNSVSEIAQLAAAGVAAVSQTGGPETVLAGEAGLAFGLVGFVTDHANGVLPEATPPETLARLFGESAGVFQRALAPALPIIAADPGRPAGFVFPL